MATSVGAEFISASAPRFTTPPAHCPVEHEALIMRTSYLCLTLLAIGIGLTGATSTWNEATSQVPQTPAANQLRPAASFAGISDQRSRSIALFEQPGKFLLYPCCMHYPSASDPSFITYS